MAFSHYIKDERLKTLEYHYKEDYYKKIKSIDINGCRRNITKYTDYNFCKYSILENWENYDGKKFKMKIIILRLTIMTYFIKMAFILDKLFNTV